MLLFGGVIFSCAILGLLGQPVKNLQNATSVSDALDPSVGRSTAVAEPDGHEDTAAEVLDNTRVEKPRQVPVKERVDDSLTCHCKSKPSFKLQAEGTWTELQCSHDRPQPQRSAAPSPQPQPPAPSVFIAHGVVDSTGRLTSSQPPAAFTVEKSAVGPGMYSVTFSRHLQRAQVPTVLVTAWSHHRHPAPHGTGTDWPMAALLQHVSKRHFRYVIVTSGHRTLDSSCSIVVVWG